MQKRAQFSLIYYLIILGVIVLLEFFFFSKPSVKEISYSKFKDLIAANKVESVVITPSKIHGLLKSPDSTKVATAAGAAATTSAKQTEATTGKQAPATTGAKQAEATTGKQAPATTSVKQAEATTGKQASASSGKTAEASGKKKPFQPHGGATPFRLKLDQYKKETAREFTVVPLDDPHLLEDLQSHGVDYRGKTSSNWFGNLFFNWIIPFGVLALVWIFIMGRMGRGGQNVLNIGKSKAKIYEAISAQRVTFNDVAGIDEAVEEVKEIVAFLKEPNKYTRLGAKLPKGVLLVGPPGTGKTLLARAVAGEAGVPFFSMSGSDFVEMFVGVGAARVRDLFAEAKKIAPCIIFIDELDAVGKSRGQNVIMGNDERETTLNQLLTEMDGFDPKIGIILMGATNRPEVLDSALLRPGRFDRQILVDRPDLAGRTDIFKVHTRGLILAKDVDLKRLAAQTPGFAGAEIANVCNEAALLASRNGKDQIGMAEFQEAIERTIAGLEKKNKLINPHERQVVAYHESGHAIVGYFTPGADPIQKVSIVPRGIGALGYTLQTPLEDRYLMSRSELLGKIKGLLGGRAAEEVVFGDISTGASNDLEKVTQIARNMMTVYGMSKKVPNISLVEHNYNSFLMQGPTTARRSEKVEQTIDEEVLEIIHSSYEDAKKLLIEKRSKLDKMAKRLLETEVIDEKEIRAILGPRPKRGARKPKKPEKTPKLGLESTTF